MAISKPEALELLTALVKRYQKNRSDYLSLNYNETQVRNDYISPFLEALGWDVKNERKAPQYLREIVQEESLDVVEEDKLFKKKPDYTIRIDGKRKYFFEAKKPSVTIAESKDASFQIRRYGWNANLAVSILTNFETLVIYDCRFRPSPVDDPHVARLHIFSYKDYVSQFDTIYDLISKDSVCHGRFDSTFKLDIKPKGADPFDEYFLSQIEQWREEIAINLLKNNKDLSQPELNYLVQQTINRIIFLRICEDRELEKYEDLKDIKDYESLKKTFLEADKKYDSGLFNFIDDQLSLKVVLDDSVLISVFTELYYPHNPYAFSVVDPQVLGAIYELFLSKELVISGKKISVQEKQEIIQSKGVVSTPQFIVDKIIDHTIIPLIDGKSPQEIEDIRISDIACGSGVFLLAAYDYLLNYHLEWYITAGPRKHRNKIIQLSSGEYRLHLSERAKILVNNVYGVDIDHQSVEVTKFSLLLKALENVTNEEIIDYITKTKSSILPNIDDNIQCGNSLVDSTYYKFNKNLHTSGQLVDVNPFDFPLSFKNIFDEGGFDAIIGNPPYIRIQNIVKYSPLEVGYFKSKHSPYNSSKSDNYDRVFI